MGDETFPLLNFFIGVHMTALNKLKLNARYCSNLNPKEIVTIYDMAYIKENQTLVLYKVEGNKSNGDRWAYENDFREQFHEI